MTRRRKQFREHLLEYLTEYHIKHHFSPSIGEMAEEFQTVRSNIHHHLRHLEQEGLLSHEPGKARSWVRQFPARAEADSIRPV